MLQFSACNYNIAIEEQCFNGNNWVRVVSIMKILNFNSALVAFGSALVLGILSTAALAADESEAEAKKVEYVRFLDLLPKALMLDKGIENASFGLEAAKETQKASRSGWYPKADITLNSARQEDFNPNAANKKYNPTEAKIKVNSEALGFW